MANFTAGTSFTDGVTNDVTAAKLNALIADAVPTSNLSLNSTTGTIATLNSTTGTIATLNSTTGTIVTGTFGTTTSTAATITTGTIPTLVATTLVTTGTGTAAAPAIVPTGDTNTGLFFPAADTIAFSEGGTEAMRIDSSGNVGIGGTPSALLHLQSTSPALRIQAASGNSSVLDFYRTASVNSGQIASESTNALVFSTNGVGNSGLVERLRIDSSGNVGIGCTAASTIRLDVQGGNIRGKEILLENGTASSPALGTTPSWYSPASGVAALSANGTERLRITSGGEVYIAGTTDQGAYNLQVNGTGVWGAGAYVNGSDSRIKEDIQRAHLSYCWRLTK
ncbi:MAG: hypothetical protein EBT26_11300 [Microbacteriaceae bacterium]|nr:hypothetical protein [Microbacteriaceae bacterium]